MRAKGHKNRHSPILSRMVVEMALDEQAKCKNLKGDCAFLGDYLKISFCPVCLVGITAESALNILRPLQMSL